MRVRPAVISRISAERRLCGKAAARRQPRGRAETVPDRSPEDRGRAIGAQALRSPISSHNFCIICHDLPIFNRYY